MKQTNVALLLLLIAIILIVVGLHLNIFGSKTLENVTLRPSVDITYISQELTSTHSAPVSQTDKKLTSNEHESIAPHNNNKNADFKQMNSGDSDSESFELWRCEHT